MLLAGVVLLAYFPALRGGFVWDDDAHVTRPELQTAEGLKRIWLELGATQQYYPLLHTAFWLEHRLWGREPLGYHLVNVVLHTVAACLLALILGRLTVPGAWLAAGLFALHPVCVESVAWISEQKNTLSTVFGLAAVLVYLRYEETRKPSDYWLATAWFLAALLTKTVTATLPGALLVLAWWRRGRLTWIRDGMPLTPWLITGAGAGLFTAWVERTYVGAQGADFAFSWIQRCLLAARSVWFYLGKLLWPADLVFIYPRWTIEAQSVEFAVFVAAAATVLIALWAWRRRTRGPLAAALIYCGMLFPVLGFVNVYPFVFSFVADHFQYSASLAIFSAMAAVFADYLLRWWPRTGRSLAALMLGGMGWLTWLQCAHFRDGEALWRATLSRNPACWMAHNNLGVLLAAQGSSRLPEAITHYRSALRLRPGYHEANYTLGNALAALPGRRPEAITHYEEALRLKPDYAPAHNNLGAALVDLPGRLTDAIAHYESALKFDPVNPESHFNLGNALARLPDRTSAAVAHYSTAIRLKPDYADAHYNLGRLLGRQPGGTAAAITHYETALRFKPDFADAHNNLGAMLAVVPGRLAEAITHYEAALRFKPDFADAHNNLANAIAQTPGRQPDAIAHFETALRLQPHSVEFRFNLANVLASTPGREPEAVKHYETALRDGPDRAEIHHNLAVLLARLPGRLPEAIAHYETALRIQPEFAASRCGLGLALLATPDRQEEGIAHLENALRLDPHFAPARAALDKHRRGSTRPANPP